MARGKYFSDFEREVIRVGVARKVPVPKIAAFLDRNRTAIYQQINTMKDAGTIDAVPFDIIADYIENQIRAAG